MRITRGTELNRYASLTEQAKCFKCTPFFPLCVFIGGARQPSIITLNHIVLTNCGRQN